MIPLEDWLVFISGLEGAVGIPFLVAGIGLMVFGARMSRASAVLAYAVIGGGLTAWLLGPQHVSWWGVLIGAAIPATIAYWTVAHAVPALGGLVMAGLTMFAFGGVGFSTAALWGVGMFAFIAFASFSFLHPHHVLVGVTAVLGSVLVISGMAVWVSAFPGFYGHVRSLVLESIFIAPFFLFVPTVVSCFYQVGDLNRRCVS